MEDYTLIFILSGKALLSCNEFMNVPFHAKEMCLLAISAQCEWKTLELVNFFLPVVKHNLEFEQFIMKNYLTIKGVKEFIDLSGMRASTFNRKFKTQFGISPYQWMIRQKAKHV